MSEQTTLSLRTLGLPSRLCLSWTAHSLLRTFRAALDKLLRKKKQLYLHISQGGLEGRYHAIILPTHAPLTGSYPSLFGRTVEQLPAPPPRPALHTDMTPHPASAASPSPNSSGRGRCLPPTRREATATTTLPRRADAGAFRRTEPLHPAFTARPLTCPHTSLPTFELQDWFHGDQQCAAHTYSSMVSVPHWDPCLQRPAACLLRRVCGTWNSPGQARRMGGGLHLAETGGGHTRWARDRSTLLTHTPAPYHCTYHCLPQQGGQTLPLPLACLTHSPPFPSQCHLLKPPSLQLS